MFLNILCHPSHSPPRFGPRRSRRSHGNRFDHSDGARLPGWAGDRLLRHRGVAFPADGPGKTPLGRRYFDGIRRHWRHPGSVHQKRQWSESRSPPYAAHTTRPVSARHPASRRALHGLCLRLPGPRLVRYPAGGLRAGGFLSMDGGFPRDPGHTRSKPRRHLDRWNDSARACRTSASVRGAGDRDQCV